MKTALSLLALIATAGVSQAGAGAPPFTNGSPLVSGVDGSYQAVVRGENLNGIIRFSYSGGNQTGTTAGNSYAIFVDGQSYTGDVQAAINTDTVAGVLENSDAVNSNTASGAFSGDMDQDSAYATFSGKGTVTIINGTLEETSTVTQTDTSTTNTASSEASSSTTGVAIGAADTNNSGTVTDGTSSVSTSDTSVDATGTGTSIGETAVSGYASAVTSGSSSSQLDESVIETTNETTSTTTDPLISTTRDFKFSGVRNSQTSQ